LTTGRAHAKIALITGAGSGIGRATAILLAKEGATVIVSDIDSQAAESVASEIRDGGGVAPMKLSQVIPAAFGSSRLQDFL
jgi:NAD(P)-dependent dehydrogenase (short-subunit alcohol dehydrogenase family)